MCMLDTGLKSGFSFLPKLMPYLMKSKFYREERSHVAKFKFVKLWDWLAYSERTKISLLVQIGGWWLHTNPSNIGLDRNINDLYQF